MRETLVDWPADLDPAWRPIVADTELGFEQIDSDLTLEPWEPIFPARRERVFPGAPKGAHIFRAFDDILPDDVRVVILGQDPYPCPAFATGRAFEAGNVVQWRELEKMFSTSVRTFMQLIAEARTGKANYAQSIDDWDRLIGDIEAGRIDLEPAAEIADRWVHQGVLLLNSSFTLSRFAVEGDPHQVRGHLPLWRPMILAVLRHLADCGKPVVLIAFGTQAADAITAAGLAEEGVSPNVACVIREHPAFAKTVLALENSFVVCNRALATAGAEPISW
ncbi:MAG: uracil-DNA glycosylase [Hyphomicrobiales bacterium]|nr:uracil-DNA glycosylase [Hyphomicrobiales bacterium]